MFGVTGDRLELPLESLNRNKIITPVMQSAADNEKEIGSIIIRG
jgi:hypothetical protein